MTSEPQHVAVWSSLLSSSSVTQNAACCLLSVGLPAAGLAQLFLLEHELIVKAISPDNAHPKTFESGLKHFLPLNRKSSLPLGCIFIGLAHMILSMSWIFN